MSFTADIKKELCQAEISHKQSKILLYGFMYCIKSREYFTESEAVKDLIKNVTGNKTAVSSVSRRGRSGFLIDLSNISFDNNIQLSRKYLDGRDENTGLFLRGAFLSCGVVTDPNKSYHLEFSVGDKERCQQIHNLIAECGMKISITCRRSQYILYSKDSEAISDILTYIGAMISSMEVMNAKIYKGVRNNVNRAVNCETANIDKTLAAARKQAEAIQLIEEKKGLGILSEDLRIIAEIRKEDVSLSLTDIGRRLDPPISKNAVYHRMKKICDIAQELK